jgi:GGDEF domain-containing protein
MKAWGDPPIPRRDDPLWRPIPDAGLIAVDDVARPATTRHGGHDGGIAAHSPVTDTDGRPLDRPAAPFRDWYWAPRTTRRRRVVTSADPGRDAIEAGGAALLRLGESIGHQELTDPVMAAAYRFARSRGVPVNVPRLLAAYTRAAERADRPDGFPWAFEPGGGLGSPISPESSAERVHWRPRDRDRLVADPAGYARWFVEPIAQVQVLELLAEIARKNDVQGEAAKPIRNALLPSIEAGFALHVAADDPWRDLFALWLLTRAPTTLNDLWYLATAIAYRYASRARRVAGPVIGTGPFEGEQLVSASAALGAVLWELRVYSTLVPDLVAFVAGSGARDGGWADPGQPTDVLTTLVAAELMLGLDPTFDPTATIAWFARAQDDDGWWRALGPEAPWLTAAVVDWLVRASGPVVARFRWPGALRIDLDRRSQLPTYAWFADLVRSVAEMPGLAGSEWEIAFIDLAGFGAFNTEYGQAMGDDVIAEFGRALARIPGSRSIRDGGDEFIVIGTPGDIGLFDRLDAFRQAWLTDFGAAFGASARPVRPRITVTRTPGAELAAARERLGRRIGELKKEVLDPPDDGVIERR